MTTITVNSPASISVPRGAIWAGNLAAAFLHWLGRASSRTVDAAQAARSRHAQASEVRRMADQWRAVDPRFAADLYAAADRHER